MNFGWAFFYLQLFWRNRAFFLKAHFQGNFIIVHWTSNVWNILKRLCTKLNSSLKSHYLSEITLKRIYGKILLCLEWKGIKDLIKFCIYCNIFHIWFYFIIIFCTTIISYIIKPLFNQGTNNYGNVNLVSPVICDFTNIISNIEIFVHLKLWLNFQDIHIV